MKRFSIIVFSALLFSSCVEDDHEEDMPFDLTQELTTAPAGFPEIPFPEDNQFSLAKWKLGKALFYDPIFSSDSTISCASCHKQSFAFSDNIDFSPGAENAEGTRNAPSLANMAYLPYYTKEGGIPTLEMQILIPIQEHNEFNSNIVVIAEKLKENSDYVRASLEAYNREPDPFVITRAIATFERTLVSGDSDYDRAENDDSNTMSPAAFRGKDLFFSDRTNCSSCHGGFNFTNNAIENNGLYETYSDKGLYRLTADENDIGKFKVPSLRNVSLTAPYMHDGSIFTLEEVVEHYVSGGSDHNNKSEKIIPLTLSSEEKDDLIAFLQSLSDISFIGNPIFNQE